MTTISDSNSNKRILQLILTEECNLRCEYCFEIDKGPTKMPLELLKKILDEELSVAQDLNECEIDILGGEPLLYFNDVKEIVAFGKENAGRWGKKIYFFIGTNLTLLTQEMRLWLKENSTWVILATSLDGTREVHDRYRCNSYNTVVSEIPLYKELYPAQSVKMTIGPDSISSIYDGILNIESMGLRVMANVVYEPVWGDVASKKKHLTEYARQLDLLITHYSDKPELNIPNLLSLPLNLLDHSIDPEFYQWCGAGKAMRAYDTDGRKLPCHRFSRFSSGKIYDDGSSIEPRGQTKCDECRFFTACPTCRGYNWQVNGNPDTRTSYHCEFIKLQLLATAKLLFLRYGEKIEKEGISKIPLQIQQNLKGSVTVFKYLIEQDIIDKCEIGTP